MNKIEHMPKLQFDKRNLRSGEEILMTMRQSPRGFRMRTLLTGGGTIPMPFALIWGIIDIGILIGVPIATGEYWLWGILVPFMAVHGLPCWIYIYGIFNGFKNYYSCGTIITTQRVLTREDRKKPFQELQIGDVASITLLSSKPHSSSIHIAAENTPITLRALRIEDAERAMDIIYDLKDMEKNKKLNERYETFCNRCGGRAKDGKCLYCGTPAELKREFKTTVKARK